MVLSRKCQESVVVGGSDRPEAVLIVTVLEVRGGAVRLGFEAGKDVPVHRREVWERIHPGDRAAGATRGPPGT